ncbi:OLC1v1007122C1 [Oldenlandia corymbosa var. corymbosa]|uniref:OLC1v1007122C1 n=1 Tax=Oldenlandia corymbosa var. corymbosa TaxID=529605 RepID=A0AAV1DLB4_OLDCO|nr:OLC1v1007122C1 [Oldenlandia corymbosa var. corymbosa]
MEAPPVFIQAFLDAAYLGDLHAIKRLVALMKKTVESESPNAQFKVENGGRFGDISFEAMQDHDGLNALHKAASRGKIKMCEYLIDELKFNVNVTDAEGQTPLFEAILGKHVSVAKFLIERGADVKKTNYKGSTPLHYAAEKGSLELVKFLISKGADIHEISEDGSPLHSAAAHGSSEVLNCLLDLGADPNYISPIVMSPLMKSMLAEALDCMVLLLKGKRGSKADPNRRTSNTTPLCYAASEGKLEMIHKLMANGADPNITDYSGLTPLEHAALNGFHAVVELLLQHTSKIGYLDSVWSCDGVMQHVNSEDARTHWKEKQKEIFENAEKDGKDELEKGDYVKAEYFYTQAMRADPADAIVLGYRSLCFAKLHADDFDEQTKQKLAVNARDDAQYSVGLRPSYPMAHYWEGQAWTLLEEHDKAVAAFFRALSLDPSDKASQKAYRDARAKVDKASH